MANIRLHYLLLLLLFVLWTWWGLWTNLPVCLCWTTTVYRVPWINSTQWTRSVSYVKILCHALVWSDPEPL